MTPLLVNDGEKKFVGYVVGNFANWRVGLFKSTHTPVVTDTLATYSAIESTFTGYSRQTPGSPSAPSIDGSNHAISTFPDVTFTATGSASEQAYGYFVEDSSGTPTLLFAGLFDSPVGIANSGDFVTVTMTQLGCNGCAF